MAEFFSILRVSASDRRPFFLSLRGIIPVLVSLLAGCANEPAGVVYLGSTTSVYDTGLLDSLVVAFEQEHPDLEVRVLAVGTGQALALGRRGDADLVLVHAPDAELEFVEAGHGRNRVTFMRNDFVIAGPVEIPRGDGRHRCRTRQYVLAHLGGNERIAHHL